MSDDSKKRLTLAATLAMLLPFREPEPPPHRPKFDPRGTRCPCGGKYRKSSYWEDGKQIYFYRCGGCGEKAKRQ